jgi:hypothetical protein
MKYYKDPNTNELYAYEADGSQDAYIKEGLVAISESDAEIVRQQNQQSFIANLPYDALRRNEYPPVVDYLDGLVKGDKAQMDAYIAACLAVKAKYPKP